MARALQGHNRSRKSALNSDAQLWDMLARVTDSVGLMFEGVPRYNCNIDVHIRHRYELTFMHLTTALANKLIGGSLQLD